MPEWWMLLPPTPRTRARLTLLCVHDSSPRSLTEKILERPRVVERIRAGIADPSRAYLTVFNSTPLERRLAVLLRIPLNGVDPSLSALGTKSGSRRAAVEVLLNTRHISELIEKGDINEIKDAMEKSMAPGSQTFEQGLFKMFMEGAITQEECMANADSATNMLWLINQATAGEISSGKVPLAAGDKKDDPKESALSTTGAGASFSDFKIDASV